MHVVQSHREDQVLWEVRSPNSVQVWNGRLHRIQDVGISRNKMEM